MHNYICIAIHKPKEFGSVIIPKVTETTIYNSAVYNNINGKSLHDLKFALLYFSSMGLAGRKLVCLHV